MVRSNLRSCLLVAFFFVFSVFQSEPGASATKDLVQKGEYLARAANCVACHSTYGGKAFSGGLLMALPFGLGEIYATNITPHPEAGIGNYTLEDFDAAMRLGVAKDGHMLYPAMPYPSYAVMSDDDIAALYAYFMEAVEPVAEPTPPNDIPWPLNARWPLKIWNYFFSTTDQYIADSAQSAEWNRGAYLVQGAGHCGSCHTPRGIFFQEASFSESGDSFLSGGVLDFWSAGNLRQDMNTGLGRWSKSDIIEYLKTGHNQFGSAFGTMTEVINYSTQFLTEEDLGAMAVYLASLSPVMDDEGPTYAYDPADEDDLRASRLESPGALIYMQKCMACHRPDGQAASPYIPPLAGNPAVMDPDPSSLINITLNGTQRIVVGGVPNAYWMPRFRNGLSDQDIAQVVSFIRSGWGNKAKSVSAEEVAVIRSGTTAAKDKVQILKMK
ncbi:MAG: alcohol dehydrogenase [Candidatus Marinimicrobia bacterium]|nr:alcohol dehydrogenase [Candidatus Neomarinimicrobiota bacterium]